MKNQNDNEVKFTPELWHWVGTNSRPKANVYLQNSKHEQILVVLDGPNEADARLIASAPELFRMCQQALNPEQHPNFWVDLRAAITKATKGA